MTNASKTRAATANRRDSLDQASESPDLVLRRLHAHPGQHRRPQAGEEQRPGRDPKAIHPRHDLVHQREQPEPSARGERQARHHQDQPPPDPSAVGRPRHRDHRQRQRDQADGGDRFPVVLVAEILGRAAKSTGAQQLEGIDRKQVIAISQAKREPRPSEAPGLGQGVRDHLDADQTDRQHQRQPPCPPESSSVRPSPAPDRGDPFKGRPRAQRDHQVKPLLRVTGQEGGRQGQGQGRNRPRPTSTEPDRRVECPGVPASGPDVRIMPLERLGQRVRRSLDATGRDQCPPSAHPQRPGQAVRPQPRKNQMADGDPAQGRRGARPPGHPRRRIEQAGLRVAQAAAGLRTRDRPRTAGDRTSRWLGRWPGDGAGTGGSGRCRSKGHRPSGHGRGLGGRRPRSRRKGRPPAWRSRPGRG